MSDLSTVTVTRSWDGWSVWRDADGDHIGTVRTHKTDEDCNDCDDETIVYALVPVDAVEECGECEGSGDDRDQWCGYYCGPCLACDGAGHLRLPRREEGSKVLRSMEPEDHERFVGRLLEAMWDAHRARELPESLTVLLRDWLAHAHFEASPIVKERLEWLVSAKEEE